MGITGRLRTIIGDRRGAPRRLVQRKASLLFSASLLNPGAAGGKAPRGGKIEGYTQDISETGLALILPGPGDRYRHLSGGGTLRITLELPGAPIVIHGNSVRHAAIDIDESKPGTLICVRITEMRERDRAYLLRFLNRVS